MLNIVQRAIVPLGALVLSLLVIVLALARSAQWLWVLVFTIPVVTLGLYDWKQTSWSITRNYPVAGRIRWLFYELRPFLRAYIVEDNLNGTPFSFEARNLIHERARGETDTHPFGTERETNDRDYHWLMHSISPENDVDLHPRVTVGNDQTSKPYSASVLNISAMSFGALSANAVMALNLGAKQGDFYHDTGEGGLSDHHLKYGGDLVWELGSGYFG
ncbi:MAG: FMN-binding glutamate synthase family protein, partial [Alphaproteobacteria bacterium HGW-Alphaproteobacteria-12]